MLKIFPGIIPRTSVKKGRGGEEEGRAREWKGGKD
jgi:hypothetical protein